MSQNDKSHLSSSFSFLTDSQWWKLSFNDARLFLPHCVLPASLLALANISLVLSLYTLSDASSLTSLTLEQLTQKLAVGSLTSLFGICLTVWALTVWLNRLTSFCRFRLANKGTAEKEKNEAINLALSAIGKSQKLLFKFWLIFSLYLLVPIIPLTLLVLIQTIAFSPTLQALNLLTVPPSVNYVLLSGIAVLTVVSVAMTIVATAVAGKLNTSYRLAALQSVKLFLNHGPTLGLVTAIVLLVNALVSAPQILVAVSSQAKPDLAWTILFQIWLGLTSTILWTLSLCPALEILRRDLIST